MDNDIDPTVDRIMDNDIAAGPGDESQDEDEEPQLDISAAFVFIHPPTGLGFRRILRMNGPVDFVATSTFRSLPEVTRTVMANKGHELGSFHLCYEAYYGSQICLSTCKSLIVILPLQPD